MNTTVSNADERKWRAGVKFRGDEVIGYDFDAKEVKEEVGISEFDRKVILSLSVDDEYEDDNNVTWVRTA